MYGSFIVPAPVPEKAYAWGINYKIQKNIKNN